MRSNALLVGAATLLVVVGASAAGVAITVTNDGDSAEQVAGPQATCDYTDLYDRTIDSVVAVRTNSGLGSGFVYRTAESNSTGYVVTNAHVVRGAESVVVQFAQETSERGTVVGRDRYTDLAVIRVEQMPTDVEALPVAEAPPEHGREVAALGTPFGLDETITHGIVSGLNRSMPTRMGFSIPNVVQTDAPINPGNSGGPLVACDGSVVGVNTAGISASRAENVGFAVSASLVTQVVPALMGNGTYEHAYLGVRTAPTTPGLVTANDLNETSGLYVHDVAADGPASGVVQGTTGSAIVDGRQVPVGGDVLVSIDGRQIASGEELSSYLLTESRPGDTVTLTVVRDGQRRQVSVTLGTRPDVTQGGGAVDRAPTRSLQSVPGAAAVPNSTERTTSSSAASDSGSTRTRSASAV